MITFDILYHDADLLIIDKPADLLCVPGLSHADNLLDLARQRFANIRTVHRLDMATSGIIIYALNHFAQKSLGHQFEARRVKKQYLAIVHGQVTASTGEISLPLICDWPNRPRQKVDWGAGKAAHTYYEAAHLGHEFTRLRLFPTTGRSHQLRVHCQSIGHPIVGDELYAHAVESARLMLHAERIEFTHPRTLKPMDIYCPAPFKHFETL
jgi:tRNA pseudouridine32 synthase/23S rRNA pseudouridine746 synthase